MLGVLRRFLIRKVISSFMLLRLFRPLMGRMSGSLYYFEHEIEISSFIRLWAKVFFQLGTQRRDSRRNLRWDFSIVGAVIQSLMNVKLPTPHNSLYIVEFRLALKITLGRNWAILKIVFLWWRSLFISLSLLSVIVFNEYGSILTHFRWNSNKQ